MAGAVLTLLVFGVHPAAGPGCDKASVAPHLAASVPTGPNPLLDPIYAGGATPVFFAQSTPLASEFKGNEAAAPLEVAESEPEPTLALPEPASSPLVETVPFPVPRPMDLQQPNRDPFRTGRRQFAQRSAPAAASSAVAPDNRSFLEKFFGMDRPTGPALAYATPEDGFFSGARSLVGNPARSYGPATAVYEITSHTVYMPNGARLEAHSGLGDRLDDPRYVHERMRGPTPPHAYDLSPREQLFHGVRALRLNPVGDGGIYGRTGLLAHTFMLGPKGDSNGCVSFRNYNEFLQAYLNGEVKRLVVVARLT